MYWLFLILLSLFTHSKLDGTSAYNFRNEKPLIQFDDNSTIFWDNDAPIQWG